MGNDVRLYLEGGAEIYRMRMQFIPRLHEVIEHTPNGGSMTKYKVESVNYIVAEFPGTPDPPEQGEDPAGYSPYVRVNLSVVV